MHSQLLNSNSVRILSVFLVTIMFFNVESSSLDLLDGKRKSNVLARERRQLLFPNSTVLQFNAGVATPIPLKDHTINVNWAFQANFQLPWNRTQIPLDILVAGTGYDVDSRKFSDAERAGKTVNKELDIKINNNDVKDTDKEEIYIKEGIENFPSRDKRCYSDKETAYEQEEVFNFENTHDDEDKMRYQDEVRLHHVYKYVDEMLSGYGFNGTSCVLRAICQLAAEPLHSDDEEDLLHELTQYLANPLSDYSEEVSKETDALPFIHAYDLGQNGIDCLQNYPDCKISLVDMFSKVHND